MRDQFTLNVGGRTFDTSKSTLTKDPHSVLAKITMYDHDMHSAFIDRDGTNFRYVLNFLRDGTCALPACKYHRQELRTEAEYFQVQGLCDLLSANDHDADSKDCRLSGRLMSLRYGLQEAKLIARLREEADPALIEEVECMLIEGAYDPDLGPFRELCLADYHGKTPHLRPSMRAYVQRYIDVIRHDLHRLGYSIAPKKAFSSADAYASVVLGMGRSETAQAAFGGIITEDKQGPALKVSQV